jgi:hypothetical protein
MNTSGLSRRRLLIFGLPSRVVLLAFLFGYSRRPNDADIQRLLVGTWRLDKEPSKTIQSKPDGSYVLQLTRGSSNVLLEGMWQVKAGFVVATMTNAPSWYGPQDPVARGRAESNKVVSINEQKLRVQSSQGGITILTAHKL